MIKYSFIYLFLFLINVFLSYISFIISYKLYHLNNIGFIGAIISGIINIICAILVGAIYFNIMFFNN